MERIVEVTYTGRLVPPNKFPGAVFRNGAPLSAAGSLLLWNHSPDGFAWGYTGSGPAQLALALLLDAVGPAAAKRWHQRFKEEVVAAWPQGEGWKITRTAIREWWLKAVGVDELVAAEGNRFLAATILAAALDLAPPDEDPAVSLGRAVADAWDALTRNDLL